MPLLKAVTKDGKTEYFNLNLILNMSHSDDGKRVKILMGGGLYWWVEAHTIEIIPYGYNDLRAELGGAPE